MINKILIPLSLAEGAQMMTRLVNYEIASLKRQISRYQQQQRVN